MMNILIVAAHPDDEVLGCGGTIARIAHEGNNVSIAILGEGITSRYNRREEIDNTLLMKLKDTSQCVGKMLGAKQVYNFNFHDNRFDTIPLLDIVKCIENLINIIQPQVIYTHHGGDLNIDHEKVFRATLTAARPVSGSPVKSIYSYEIPSSTEWSMDKFSPPFRPNIFVNIHDTLKLKLQAISLYDSEARSFPHPRSPEALESTAKRWGSISGCHAAEAFELVRELR